MNTLSNEIGLTETDFDDVNHLNINGANKVSRYLGNYLASSYELRDWKENEEWKKDYELFEKYDAEKRIENDLVQSN